MAMVTVAMVATVGTAAVFRQHRPAWIRQPNVF